MPLLSIGMVLYSHQDLLYRYTDFARGFGGGNTINQNVGGGGLNYTRKASVWAVVTFCGVVHPSMSGTIGLHFPKHQVEVQAYVEWGSSKSYVTDDLYVSAEDQVV